MDCGCRGVRNRGRHRFSKLQPFRLFLRTCIAFFRDRVSVARASRRAPVAGSPLRVDSGCFLRGELCALVSLRFLGSRDGGNSVFLALSIPGPDCHPPYSAAPLDRSVPSLAGYIESRYIRPRSRGKRDRQLRSVSPLGPRIGQRIGAIPQRHAGRDRHPAIHVEFWRRDRSDKAVDVLRSFQPRPHPDLGLQFG